MSLRSRRASARCVRQRLRQRRLLSTTATTTVESEPSCTEAVTGQKVRSRSGQDNEVKELAS